METRLEIRAATAQDAARYLADFECYQAGELNDAQLFVVGAGDDDIGVFAVKIINQTGWLLAGAGGLPNHDLTAELLPVIAEQFKAAGCSEMLLRTARHGLVKKLAGAGYELNSLILRKAL